jgi:hypothetical protein
MKKETRLKKQAAPANKTVAKKKQIFPRGWNEKRVQDVIAYYDRQTEEEELAEYEAAMELEGVTMILVPNQFVPAVRQLIGRRRGA